MEHFAAVSEHCGTTARRVAWRRPHERRADAIRRMLYFTQAPAACALQHSLRHGVCVVTNADAARASRWVHGAMMCQPHGGTHMQWTTPSYTDMRFGFEITMYIATR